MSSPSVQHRRVAVVLGLEALLVAGVGLWQLIGVSAGEAGRPEVAWGSSTYFVLFAVIVAVFAVAAWRGAIWVYGPAVFLQVLAAPLAVTMATEGLWVGAVLLGGTAATGLVLLVGEGGRVAFERHRLDSE